MQFVKASDKYCSCSEFVPAPLFRKSFEVNDTLKEAHLDIAVSGFYELYVNGENITRGLLAPYVNNPDQIIYLDSYDITPYLKKGKNAVGVLLGNGFANQDVNGLNESENHHFLGDIIRVFVSRIAGLSVNPDLDGKNTFTFAPTVAESLDYAKSEYDFECGKAVCGWEKTEYGIRFYAEVPSGAKGEFVYNNTRRALTTGHNEFIMEK